MRRVDLQLKLSSDRDQRRRKAPDRAAASRTLAWVAAAAIAVSVFGSPEGPSAPARPPNLEPPAVVAVAASQPQPVAADEVVQPPSVPQPPAAVPPKPARPAVNSPPAVRPAATAPNSNASAALTADPAALTFQIRRESSQSSGQTSSERKDATGGLESRNQSRSSSETVESGQRLRSVSINPGAGAQVTIGKPVLTGSPDALAVFAIERDSCAGQTLLPATGGCRITIGFDASEKGAFGVQLIVPTDRGTLTIPVTGTFTIQDR